MTWLGQVLHVARKDVGEEARPLVAYLAVTALAAVVVFVQPAMSYSAALAFIVFLLGMILIAAVVQSDSPTASESFWGSRPFRPTAMLGAKVLLATLIVLVPSVVQVVALAVFGVDGGDAAVAILQSARMYALWLLAAMAIASLTRDVRTFAVSFAAIFAAFALAVTVWSDFIHPSAPRVSTDRVAVATSHSQLAWLVGPVLWTAVAVFAAIVLLGFLYRRRDARRRVWVAALAVVGIAVSAAFTDEPARARPATAASIPIHVELLRSDRLGLEEQLSFRVATSTDADSRRLVLAVDRVIVRLKDGKAVTVPGMESSTALIAAGNPLGAKVRLLRDERDSYSNFALPLSFDQRSAFSKGISGLELAGTLFIFEPRIVGMLQMQPNQSLMRSGVRLRIANVTPAPDGGMVAIQTTSLPRPESFPFVGGLSGFGGRLYALVNEARGEMAYPNRNGGGGAPTMLVLPTMPLTTDYATFQLKRFDGTVLDAAWFMGARLALVELTPRGQYDVRIPIVKVPTSLAQSSP